MIYRSKAYTRLYITVTNAPPDLSPGYARPNSTYTRGASMANNTVDSSLGGGQSSAATYANAFFTVSPALPSGLALDPNTGTISGIPMVSVITHNVITASNYCSSMSHCPSCWCSFTSNKSNNNFFAATGFIPFCCICF